MMDVLLIVLAVGLLLWFPPTRGITKVWILASIVLVWLLDSATRDVLGD